LEGYTAPSGRKKDSEVKLQEGHRYQQ